MLFMDIDLGNDSLSGIEVANKLKRPVLFISGNNAAYLRDIEHLKREFDFPVDHITKPISEDIFVKTLKRFFAEVQSFHQRQFVHLDFKDTKRTKIEMNDIVHICTEKDKGAASGNKVIYFTNRKPEVLIDFEFVTMEQKGFSSNQFLKIHTSFRVNVNRIDTYNKSTHHIEVTAVNTTGKLEKMMLPVSENYRNLVKSNYPKG